MSRQAAFAEMRMADRDFAAWQADSADQAFRAFFGSCGMLGPEDAGAAAGSWDARLHEMVRHRQLCFGARLLRLLDAFDRDAGRPTGGDDPDLSARIYAASAPFCPEEMTPESRVSLVMAFTRAAARAGTVADHPADLSAESYLLAALGVLADAVNELDRLYVAGVPA